MPLAETRCAFGCVASPDDLVRQCWQDCHMFRTCGRGPRVMSPNRGEDQYRTRHGEDRRWTDLRNSQHPMERTEVSWNGGRHIIYETRPHDQPLAPSHWSEMN